MLVIFYFFTPPCRLLATTLRQQPGIISLLPSQSSDLLWGSVFKTKLESGLSCCDKGELAKHVTPVSPRHISDTSSINSHLTIALLTERFFVAQNWHNISEQMTGFCWDWDLSILFLLSDCGAPGRCSPDKPASLWVAFIALMRVIIINEPHSTDTLREKETHWKDNNTINNVYPSTFPRWPPPSPALPYTPGYQVDVADQSSGTTIRFLSSPAQPYFPTFHASQTFG